MINTPAGKLSMNDDSYLRKEAIRHAVPYVTTLAAAKATANGIAAFKQAAGTMKSLHQRHADIG